jgi:WD40 repeat protein
LRLLASGIGGSSFRLLCECEQCGVDLPQTTPLVTAALFSYIEFSPDGALLAVGVINGTVRLLDVASGKNVDVLQYRGETDIHDLAFSPDGRLLAAGCFDSQVYLWGIPTNP